QRRAPHHGAEMAHFAESDRGDDDSGGARASGTDAHFAPRPTLVLLLARSLSVDHGRLASVHEHFALGCGGNLHLRVDFIFVLVFRHSSRFCGGARHRQEPQKEAYLWAASAWLAGKCQSMAALSIGAAAP